MSVVVVATIVPLAEHRDEVIAAFKETIEQVHDEDGCELYSLNEAPDRLIMIEKWASPEALRVHSTGAALAALNPRLAGKVAGPARGHRAAAGAGRRGCQGRALNLGGLTVGSAGPDLGGPPTWAVRRTARSVRSSGGERHLIREPAGCCHRWVAPFPRCGP